MPERKSLQDNVVTNRHTPACCDNATRFRGIFATLSTFRATAYPLKINNLRGGTGYAEWGAGNDTDNLRPERGSMTSVIREVYASDADDAELLSRECLGRYQTEPAARRAVRAFRARDTEPNTSYTLYWDDTPTPES